MPRDDITGFVLAGGRSQRMGRDKRLIRWGTGTLLSHATEQMAQIASRVIIVGGESPEGAFVATLQDSIPGRGPLAGIHSALTNTKTDWNLVLAVDMPLVTSTLLGYIAKQCGASASLAVVPRTAGHFQPLCAAYHRNLLPHIESALENEDPSIHRLLQRLSTRIMNMQIIEESELGADGFRPEVLLNVNTPEELKQARAIATIQHG